MPKKKPGIHHIHVKVTEHNFRVLQEYCNAGAERLTASAIVDYLMATYIENHLQPRMARGESATHNAIREDISKVAVEVAYNIEPTAFAKPESADD